MVKRKNMKYQCPKCKYKFKLEGFETCTCKESMLDSYKGEPERYLGLMVEELSRQQANETKRTN